MDRNSCTKYVLLIISLSIFFEFDIRKLVKLLFNLILTVYYVKTSKDLLTWAPPVDDVAYSTYTDRPGMTTVTRLPNKQYMMTYEFGGGKVISFPRLAILWSCGSLALSRVFPTQSERESIAKLAPKTIISSEKC
jgi:hypothetical protein